MNMTLIFSIILDMTLLYFLIFSTIMFLVYFDYMLGIVGLVLYSNICLYNAFSLDLWVSGRHCVGGAYTVFAYDSTHIPGVNVVVHGCDTPVEPFVAHASSIGLADLYYKERIALFLIFLSNVPMRGYKPTLP